MNVKDSRAQPLSDRDLAGLHLRFVVPMAVGHLLRGDDVLDDVAEYNIYEMIGELDVDTALLCVALCAQHVAARASHTPMGCILGAEAERIVNDYAPLWLAHEAGTLDISSESLDRILSLIPEDLESLGDLLLAAGADLNDDSDVLTAIMCDILATVAHHQYEKAEAEFKSVRLSRPLPMLGGNVIPFPGPVTLRPI